MRAAAHVGHVRCGCCLREEVLVVVVVEGRGGGALAEPQVLQQRAERGRVRRQWRHGVQPLAQVLVRRVVLDVEGLGRGVLQQRHHVAQPHVRLRRTHEHLLPRAEPPQAPLLRAVEAPAGRHAHPHGQLAQRCAQAVAAPRRPAAGRGRGWRGGSASGSGVGPREPGAGQGTVFSCGEVVRSGCVRRLCGLEVAWAGGTSARISKRAAGR